MFLIIYKKIKSIMRNNLNFQDKFFFLILSNILTKRQTFTIEILTHLRLVFPSRTNSKSFHYFPLNFIPNHLINRGHSFLHKWLIKENNRNRIFNFKPINFFLPISLLQYLETDFRKEKYYNVFRK